MDSEGNRKSYAQWGVTQYAKYNQNTNAIEIDWNAIDKVTDNTTGKAIEDYIKRLEELQKLYEQTNSDILDIEAEVDEINQRGKNEFLTYEQRIYDAIV
jgi:predicted  nucleic acid-binding Zn-ribbon protein